MPKPTLCGRKTANRELQPELYLDRPKGRGFRPSYDEMREALIATRGRYGLASIRLQCAERSLRDWVRQDQSLVELVEELRTLRIDKSEARIDQIADDPTHPRSFDANRLIVERLGRHRGWGAYLEVAGKLQQTVEVSPYVPIDQRDFHPEAWDCDEHARFAELAAIPVHKLTRDQFDEIQDLKKKAKVLILNAEGPARELKSLPPPADRPVEVEDTIDRSEPGEATNEDEV
jgi:hypothetical protein